MSGVSVTQLYMEENQWRESELVGRLLYNRCSRGECKTTINLSYPYDILC